MIVWLLAGYIWLFVHRPQEWFSLFAAGRVVLLYMICVTLVWLLGWMSNQDNKRPLGNIFTLAVLFYTLAITVAALFSPYMNILENDDWWAWLRYVLIFVIMMTSIKTERDLKIVVTTFIVAFFLWMAHSYRGYLQGNAFYSAGAYRIRPVGTTFTNANDYGTMIVCALPLLVPLVTLCKRYWHYLFVLGYILLALRSVLLTGSRGSLVMLATLAILPVLFSRHRFKLIPIICIAFQVGWFAMTDEMQNRYRTLWDSSISEEANKNLQGRADGFYGGWTNWSNYPIFGVGPGQHGPALGQNLRSHNLIGEVVGEMGTVGAFTFLFMLSCFGLNHYNIWKNYKYLQEKNLGKEGLYCWRVSLAIVYAVIMLQLQGLSLHTAYWYHWLWFGAFQALAVQIMQEKVNDATQGKLLPSQRTTKR